VSQFSQISKYLIIEFIDKTDSKVQQLLLNRKDIFDDYSIDNFQNEFSKYYKILKKEELNEQITLFEVHAPYVARKVKAGQFIILRVDEFGERIPLTVADYDRVKGSVTIIYQIRLGIVQNVVCFTI